MRPCSWQNVLSNVSIFSGLYQEDQDSINLIQKAKRLHREGLTYREISNRLSLSLGKVYEAINTDLRTVKAKYEAYLTNNSVQ